jgi:hypothetical protein
MDEAKSRSTGTTEHRERTEARNRSVTVQHAPDCEGSTWCGPVSYARPATFDSWARNADDRW